MRLMKLKKSALKIRSNVHWFRVNNFGINSKSGYSRKSPYCLEKLLNF